MPYLDFQKPPWMIMAIGNGELRFGRCVRKNCEGDEPYCTLVLTTASVIWGCAWRSLERTEWIWNVGGTAPEEHYG